MKLNAIIDSRHNSPIAKGAKNIIYSISWHPLKMYFVIGTSTGYIMIFDAIKKKLISYVQDFPE